MQGLEGQTQAAAQTTLEIEVERGPLAGQRFSLAGELRIGSGESGHGTLSDPWLSPAHALIAPSADGWVVEDLRSVEGTRVSGRPVRAATALRAGDSIELGSTRLVVLPDGLDALAEHPERRAREAAGTLAAESRRALDGKRLAAMVVDALLLLAATVVLLRATGTRAVTLIAAVGLYLAYFFLCESLTGQTLGKKLLGLRVVRRDGHPLTPQAVAGRTVLRIVDDSFCFAVGAVTMLLTGGRRQRLGDLAVGTIVTRASYHATRAPLQGRNLFALVAYPLVWLAPALVFYVVVPAARVRPCAETRITTSSREGTCRDRDGRVYTIVNLGHTLHMSEFDARLVKTGLRSAVIPEAARYGFDGGRALVLGFRVELKNTGSRPILVDRRTDLAAYQVVLPDGRPQRIGELPARIRAGFRPFAGPRGVQIAPGRTHTGWVRFVLPEIVRGRLDLRHGALTLRLPSHEGNDLYLGQFSLSSADSVEAATIAAPLNR